MDQFGYVVSLLSIITGLALSDIGVSLHRLLKRRSNVQGDWLTLAIAAYVSFILIRYWYQVWSIRDVPGVTGLFFFLTIVVEDFILFLMAASSLPDEIDLGDGVLDLREFQQRNSIYLWRLFLIFSLSWAAHGFYFATALRGEFSLTVVIVFASPVLLATGLAFVRQRKFQIPLFAALVAHEAWWMIVARF